MTQIQEKFARVGKHNAPTGHPRPPTLVTARSAAGSSSRRSKFDANHSRLRGAARMGNSERHFGPSRGDLARAFFEFRERLSLLLRDPRLIDGLALTAGYLLP